MSKENLDQFIQQISDSEELQARIGEEIDTDAFITLGTEHGCEFSAEDLAESAELSDEELDGVAAGHSLGPVLHENVASFKLDGTKYRIGRKHAPAAMLHDNYTRRGF